jgi:RHH-type proline utilization regulon transcriptional repressor/proline dehydrogenase/delta 1-pyrroline-5-carboxylate dehydrogenase
MADELKYALVKSGRRVREYCPVGELLPGMAYLVRRLLENTSNEGFLRAAASNIARDQLLEAPFAQLRRSGGPPLPTDAKLPTSPSLFTNAPNTDFIQPAARERMQSALAKLASQPTPVWPLIIAGKRLSDRERIPSVNPAKPSQIVGHWARATLADADRAVAASRDAQPEWADQPVAERARILRAAADAMERRRFELNALEVLEAGNPGWKPTPMSPKRSISAGSTLRTWSASRCRPSRSRCPANVACSVGWPAEPGW